MLRRCSQPLVVSSFPSIASTAVSFSCCCCLPSSRTFGRPSGVSATPLSTEQQQEFLKNFREKLDKADAPSTEKFMVDAALEEGTMGLPCAPGGGGGVQLREPGPTASMEPEKVPMVKRGQEPLPKWLRLARPTGEAQARFNQVRRNMREKKLATVCEQARCPNIGECWGGTEVDDVVGGAKGADRKKEERVHVPTATIMIMGDTCTRACRFCAVKTARIPPPLDPLEPEKTAKAINEMSVPYIVITMVDRDDLPDSGAAHVVRTIEQVKEKTTVMLECLVGDFQGQKGSVAAVANAGLDVYAHNIECVERITGRVRDRRAGYRQSLATLEHAKASNSKILTKTSIMLGLGETAEEILQTLRDLRDVGCDAVTFGQYLQPSRTRMKVERYVHPTEFEMWKKQADEMGFVYCASGPMVRSSYRAGEYYMTALLKKRKEDAASSADAAATATDAASPVK